MQTMEKSPLLRQVLGGDGKGESTLSTLISPGSFRTSQPEKAVLQE